MKILGRYFLIAAMAVVLISCKDQENKPQNQVSDQQKLTVKDSTAVSEGTPVPNDEVCMVNDLHMGKKQIEVPFGGKMYYGCCNMCVERIPNDENVRQATDPHTGVKVDKASAYIVSLNKQGNVAYFESEENYQNFIQANKELKK
ncbi:hypothetical protein [Flavobacterium lipolyticum]|uniref:MlpB protein n=1 Tax=Flavobacterium lipolyticum TaxID=2893754 RepID=A0ABS8M4K6_9FLAO|nr:hypothetical protein [Flavobacterium sp. F-126]MCC9019753.1 hypothetical protein [Flavobacterium sp. F-126]